VRRGSASAEASLRVVLGERRERHTVVREGFEEAMLRISLSHWRGFSRVVPEEQHNVQSRRELQCVISCQRGALCY
jgi:hypothetical protein